MKLKELKHNHSLTDLLKILIFSILMITPLLSVATRCLYVICNKNAYQSYTNTTYKTLEPIYYESNEVSTYQDIIIGNIYYYSNNISSITYSGYTTYKINLDLFKSQYNMPINDATGAYIYFQNNNQPVSMYFTRQNANDYYINISAFPMYVVFESKGSNAYTPIEFISSLQQTNFEYVKEYVEVTQTGTLDNVFEYSVNKLAESPILSWTQQTAIYTGVNTMTTQLGVTTPTIAMLIVYWFLLTVIYIIIDIIIKVFTWLTHMIGNKSV